MQVFARTPTVKNPPEQFTGDVWLDPIAFPRDQGQRMVVARVRFAPGARTAWHSHALGQTCTSLRASPGRSPVAAPRLRPTPGRPVLPARPGTLARSRG